MIYLNSNDQHRPRFDTEHTFFCRQLPIDGPLAARMLALQSVKDLTQRALLRLDQENLSDADITSMLEDLWRETSNLVGRLVESAPRLGGDSVAARPSEPATEAATSTPSRDTLKLKGSRSSTK